ncbi:MULTISPECIES: galactokinase [unclassified Paenibacillus]|uniref:galactokinase n=1 Tax=unclassified Paenibacillus TaxID=185978 RepID=UPI0009560788|nr:MULTISPECIES: galactokinase [unclassified Paenibacillus]ASS66766.1 galactokinase [Paenibacillus sp. RUD330]SIP96067.1 galactokinase [Paenibacillus sp. RU4X]SIQ14557.1 galactokinase [Paenibacillus sp. RU4T]
MADLLQLNQQFLQAFGENGQNIQYYYAPGRVNLIGEHTDYNGGYVFPAALTFGTTLLLRPRGDRVLRMASANFPLTGEIDLDSIAYREEDDWMNYPKGVVKELQNRGKGPAHGYDMLYNGEIPNGAGLSSSASIEVLTAYALLAEGGHDIDRTELALLAQKSENEFNGVQCGIMDQFAVANGRENEAILLMCDTLEHRHVPFDSGDCVLVIGNTNKRRGLVDSKYNERRAECDQAVQDLRSAFPDLTLLGQLTPEQLERESGRIASDTVRKRAKHVVEEIARVLESVRVLEKGDLNAFGALMNASHDSLRDLYEVTGPELDAMVEAARMVPGVLGSRMTGAGFGGCTVSLVRKDSVDGFQAAVADSYGRKTGLIPDFYVCSIGGGAGRLDAPV